MRRKGYANPITVFTNIDKITRYLRGHGERQGAKAVPDQIDPAAWVYDIGENSDCSVDALVSDNVADLVATFRELPTAKASFATKFVSAPAAVGAPVGPAGARCVHRVRAACPC